MHHPRSGEELLGLLVSLGMAIGLGKLLFSKQQISWRSIGREALSAGGLAAGAAIPLFYFKDANPAAVVGLGVLLATLGLRGIQKLVTAWKGSK